MSQSPSLRGSGRFLLKAAQQALPPDGVSIPFIAGQWSLHEAVRAQMMSRLKSQSPSLRGSGRFGTPSPPEGGGRAVSQSPSLRGSGRFEERFMQLVPILRKVSIPFIAGQWSLPRRGRAARRSAARLNPLHCGAVVASGAVQATRKPNRVGLNPLHCGAVVASTTGGGGPRARAGVSIPFIAGQWSLRIYGVHEWKYDIMSQSPSLRGSGRFPRTRRTPTATPRVSIPFIAGQWSLRGGRGAGRGGTVGSQSPSLRGSGRFPSRSKRRSGRRRRLNPLHCGAVVASPPARRRRGPGPQVSIPFIAGQWSLPSAIRCGSRGLCPSQSPSLRGSGRFLARTSPRPAPMSSQSPSLRGSGRFEPTLVNALRRVLSQSPSLRGSGRFRRRRRRVRRAPCRLNPLHCGAVVASCGAPAAPARTRLSQSPSLRGSGRFRNGREKRSRRGARLNPLHCGAVVASPPPPRRQIGARMSQSPSLRGSGRFKEAADRTRAQERGLNPLHCGAVVASDRAVAAGRGRGRGSQSPSLRGSGRFRRCRVRRMAGVGRSQSPSLRGSGRFASRSARIRRRRRVSIPFIAGQWSLRRAWAAEGRAQREVSIPFIAGQWSLL